LSNRPAIEHITTNPVNVRGHTTSGRQPAREAATAWVSAFPVTRLTVDLATWLRSPDTFARFAAFKREADTGRRAVLDRQHQDQQAGAAAPARSTGSHV
jgi:hypothetical protein